MHAGTGGFLTSTLDYLDKQVNTPEDKEKYNESIYGSEKKSLPYLLCVANMLFHNIEAPNIEHRNSLSKNVRDYTSNDKYDIIAMNPPYGGSELKNIQANFPADLRGAETSDLFMTLILYRLKENGRAAVILPDGFLFGTDNTKINIKRELINNLNLHTIIRMPNSVFSPYTSITTNILFFDKTKKTKDIWYYRMDLPEGYKSFSKTKPMKNENFNEVKKWWENKVEIKDEKEDENSTQTYKAKKYTAQEIKSLNYNLDLCGYPRKEELILEPKELIKEYQKNREKLNEEIDKTLAQINKLLEE